MKRTGQQRYRRVLGAAAVICSQIAAAGVSAADTFEPAPDQQSTRELVERSRELMRAYDYEGALQAAEQAVATAPLDIEANEALRSALSRAGNRRELAGRYRQLVEQFPNSAAANYLLSTAIGEREQADFYLQEALRLDPNFGPAVQAMARRTSRRRGSDEALELARHAMELMPGDFDAVNTYVRELRRHDRDQEAISVLRQMTQMFPNELRYWTALWSAELQAMGRRERSIGPLLTEISAQRFRFMGSMEDMELLAGVLASGGPEGDDMAADVWMEIAERYPEHPRAQRALLQAARSATDPDRQIEILERLVELYPGSPAVYRAHEDMIKSLIRRDRFDEAIEVARSVIELPDEGFEESGAGRDGFVNDTDWGRSLVCIGHLGWFEAARSKAETAVTRQFTMEGSVAQAIGTAVESVGSGRPQNAEVTVAFVSDDGQPQVVRVQRRERPVTPEAAAAAQSLLASDCTEHDPIMSVARRLDDATAYAVLGIQLMEKAAALQPLIGPSGEALTGRERREAEVTRNRLAGLYLDAGRIDEALRVVEEVVGGVDISALRRDTARTAAQVYEAAGSTRLAKAHYLWAMEDGRRGQDVDEALVRLYESTSSVEIKRFSAEEAPIVQPESIVLRPPELVKRAPLDRPELNDSRPPEHDVRTLLERYLGHDLTLIYLWSPDFLPSGANLPVLGPLEDMYPDGNFGTLAIAVSRSASSAVRSIRRDPGPGTAVAADLGALADFSVNELPTALLVDASGRVLARQMSFGIDPESWALGWLEVIDEELARRRPGQRSYDSRRDASDSGTR